MNPFQVVASLVSAAFSFLVLGLLVSAPRPAVAQSAAPKPLCPSAVSNALKEAACQVVKESSRSGDQFTLLKSTEEVGLLIHSPSEPSENSSCQERFTATATVVQVTPAGSAPVLLSEAYRRSACGDVRADWCWPVNCPQSAKRLNATEFVLIEPELISAASDVIAKQHAYVLLTYAGSSRRVLTAKKVFVDGDRIEQWSISGRVGAVDVVACPNPGRSEEAAVQKLAELVERPTFQAGRIYALCNGLEVWVDDATGEGVIAETLEERGVVVRRVAIKPSALAGLRAQLAALDARYRSIYQIAAYLSCYSPKTHAFHSRLGVALGQAKSAPNPLTLTDCK